jgi:P4 family phage/plasmid primase-like protien
MTATSPGDQGAEMWEDFLETVTEGDQGKINFLQMVAGMALFGKVYHEGIILAYGAGRNGKSTLFNALAAALGDYSGSIAVTTLTVDKGNRGASMATLRGRRLVITGELEDGQRLSVSVLKQLASTDQLMIEEKFKAPEAVTPSHTILLYTNVLPKVGTNDNGTWRRLLVVPFTATIPVNGTIANYGDVLTEQAGPAILKWAVEGAVKFARNNYQLIVPDSVKTATDEYRSQEDWLSNFLNERCTRDPRARVRAGALYSTYQAWCSDNNEYTRRAADFSAALKNAGFTNIRPGNKSTWVGLRIKEEDTYEGEPVGEVIVL